VKPARYSGIQISPKLVPAGFPGRIQQTVHSSWREGDAVIRLVRVIKLDPKTAKPRGQPQ
jgi:hypothetical protein